MSREDFILRRAAEKRAAILAAARARFGADGFDGASVERIAADAHVSTATLYRQFPSKLALFEAVLRDRVTAFEAALRGQDGAPARAAIATLAHAYAALLDSNETGGIVRAAFAAAAAEPQIADVFYTAVKATVAGAFQAAMAQARAEGAITADQGDRLRAGAHLMGMIEHAILWRRLLANADGEDSPAEIAEAALSTFWAAFRPR